MMVRAEQPRRAEAVVILEALWNRQPVRNEFEDDVAGNALTRFRFLCTRLMCHKPNGFFQITPRHCVKPQQQDHINGKPFQRFAGPQEFQHILTSAVNPLSPYFLRCRLISVCRERPQQAAFRDLRRMRFRPNWSAL